jgi:D-3-phosphoglycerate dehydrogenase / 2-oxoglutarate reductase
MLNDTHSALICDRYSPSSLSHLQQQAGLVVRTSPLVQPSAADLKETSILLIRSRTTVDRKLLAATPKLKLVVTATSGFDHIDLVACRDRGITVTYTPLANAQAAAELALLLTLSCLRRVGDIQRTQSLGLWKDQLRSGHELRKKTVGLIGFGHVGRAFATLLHGFSCEVLAYDPYVGTEVMSELKVRKVNLTEILKSANVLSLHVPLTQETRGLIGRSNLEEMSSEVILINTSRGPVINEKELVEALRHQAIAGAGLDVFQTEPLPLDSPLRTLPNVVWTPHVGALTDEALARASLEAAGKVRQFIETGSIDDALPNCLSYPVSACLNEPLS